MTKARKRFFITFALVVLTIAFVATASFAAPQTAYAESGDHNADILLHDCIGWISVIFCALTMLVLLCLFSIDVMKKRWAKIFACSFAAAMFLAVFIILCVHPCGVSVRAFIAALALLVLTVYLYFKKETVVEDQVAREPSDEFIEGEWKESAKEQVAAPVEEAPAIETAEEKAEEAPVEAEQAEEVTQEEAIVAETPAEEPEEAVAEEAQEAVKEEAEEEVAEEAEEPQEVAAEEVAEETQEQPEERVTLRESFAMAAATESAARITKKEIAEYLDGKYAQRVQLNCRGNLTKTGLPLADTHYAVMENGKTCFTYVYETEGATMLLLKVTPEVAKTFGHKDTVRKSAFPKAKATWYSVIVDESYTKQDVYDMLDKTLALYIPTATEQTVTLRESLAQAAAETAESLTKKDIAEYLGGKYAQRVQLNCRGNFTKTGLPLADTHYAMRENGKTCFIYVFETTGAAMMLLKMPDELAQTFIKSHATIRKSAFPKAKASWYSVIIDGSYTKNEVYYMLDKVLALYLNDMPEVTAYELVKEAPAKEEKIIEKAEEAVQEEPVAEPEERVAEESQETVAEEPEERVAEEPEETVAEEAEERVAEPQEESVEEPVAESKEEPVAETQEEIVSPESKEEVAAAVVEEETLPAAINEEAEEETQAKTLDFFEETQGITLAEADALLSDEEALASIEYATKSTSGKKGVINLDVISKNFSNGDTVTIGALKNKKLIAKNVMQVKLLARGKLDKKLNVELQEYSIQAVKMILVMGGTVKKA